ncbi:hypothetical protein AAE02nite_33650 [Adhaeribacter aerolatus]|uniref:DUF922 domain-containing protein n=1 Tax=Adhaeribacter aerolatus TaxID=670289 RepID=A0A512B161_9BACT|nr:DUF922 domain-containing protein [Adhaeribacter aerolatus]GEO05701.1 hypothetical protein AAE02nite_33650 [Adhaeribacter aerolatus]
MRSCLLVVFGLFLSLRGLGQQRDTLIYSMERKLTWADFKGKPKPADRHNGAQITVTINLQVKKVNFWTGKARYDAVAVAFTDASWVKAAYKEAYTLAHEQLHFDIAHLYAETLELELNSLDRTARQKEQVENRLQQYIKDMTAYQELYDQETSGGNNIARQKEWAAKIKKDVSIINKAL